MPRLDVHLVTTGRARSRERAKAMIAAGRVRIGGAVATKPSAHVAEDARVEALDDVRPYVSRGALKLAAGLDAFGIAPAGRVCLDLGASTGGFTQVLLERGAARVFAVDVGHGQLAPEIARDPRVANLEGTHAKTLDADLIPEPPALLVCDVSFISVRKALPPVFSLLAERAEAVVLVKPQFEVGRSRIGKGGIVRDAGTLPAFLDAEIVPWFEASGWTVHGHVSSPITGGDGNVEFLLGAHRG